MNELAMFSYYYEMNVEQDRIEKGGKIMEETLKNENQIYVWARNHLQKCERDDCPICNVVGKYVEKGNEYD